MQSEYDRAKHALDQLIATREESGPDRNEATTRLHLIDRLLIDCLGWPAEEAVAEHRLDNGYADYVLGRPIPRMLVEAKREGVDFTLPAGLDRSIYLINTLFENNRPIESAVRQAAGYAQERGLEIAVVSNGHQIIAFVASRQDGIPPLSGRALVYDSLANMRARFREFWDNLSRPGLEALNLLQTVGVSKPAPPPEKLSQRLLNYPGYKNRNRIQASLQILSELFLEDIVNTEQLEEDFLRECYSPSGALSQYALVSREILRTRFSTLHESEAAVTALPARTKSGVSDTLRSDIVAASFSKRPIILLGDVGSGKTIFIRHLINIDAKDLMDRALVLYVNFGVEPAFPEDLNNYVIEQFSRQLDSKYGINIEDSGFVRGVYHGELLRFGRGIYSSLREIDEQAFRREELKFLAHKLADRGEHLRSSLEHASKARKRQVVVFLDNVDQRPFQFQEEVFLIAESLAGTWPGTVFVALRPDTFHRSRQKGTLAAYQPRVFTIAPPRVDAVINKRIDFASKQLGRENVIRAIGGELLIQTDTLSKYLKVLAHSLGMHHELMEFIDNLSGGNVRRALSFVQAFIGSGHVDTDKILRIFSETGRYDVALHEFMRAVIYGDNDYFDPASSPVVNLFDISEPDGREHFLLPIMLAIVENLGGLSGQEGFAALSEVYTSLLSLGFGSPQFQFAMRRARDKNLVESSPLFGGDSIGGHCRLTTIGAYSLKRLPEIFTYIDAIVVDTPVVEQRWRQGIRDVRTISDRLARAETFRAYLDRQWLPLEGKNVGFDWPAHSDRLRDETTGIGRQIDPANWV